MLDDKLVEGFPSNIKDVLIVGSDQYQRVMKAAVEDLIKAGKIDKGAAINVTKGGIGEQRAQLGKYLSSLPSTEGKPAKTPREFYMEMIPAAGFKRLDPNDPRRYKNKAGKEFLTFERDGVRIAVEGNTILFAADRGVGMYMGEGTDLLLQAMIVDEGARQQGRATKAMQDILEMADQAGMTTYIEPVQVTKGVGMTTDQLKAFYKRFGFEPQKAVDWTEPKQPATDRVMVRQPGAKIEAAPAKAAPKEKFEAPTITPGQQRNLDYWKANVEPALRSYFEAYNDVGVERLEDANIKPKGISATEWLLQLRDQKSIFVQGRKTSQTGLQMLSKKDLWPTKTGDGEVLRKAMLKAIQALNKAPGYNSNWITSLEGDINARKRQQKEEDEGWEFMLKGTEDQQKGVRAVAETVGGTPVYFDPETNVGLVRGYGELAGTPIYSMTMGDRYSNADVEESTVSLFAPYKAKLIEVKKQLEKEAEQKHKDDPFITFKDGIAMSADIDKATGEIFKEWKSMLGLGNVNIYLSTFEDAKKNVDNFTGPHRVIGSGLLASLTGGRMRGMPDGSYLYCSRSPPVKQPFWKCLLTSLATFTNERLTAQRRRSLKTNSYRLMQNGLKGAQTRHPVRQLKCSGLRRQLKRQRLALTSKQ